MTRIQRQFMIAFAIGAAAAVANAEQPYQRTYGIEGAGNRSNAALILHARLHPEVEVDRSLAAQPVHPWMAQVQLGGGVLRADGDVSVSGQITTWIDPLNDLVAQGLDENHSLVKAQRLHRSLTGTDTQAMNDLRHNAHAAFNRTIGGSTNRIVLAPGQTEMKPWNLHDQDSPATPQPVLIIPKKQLEVERHPNGHLEIRYVPQRPDESDTPATPQLKIADEDQIVASR